TLDCADSLTDKGVSPSHAAALQPRWRGGLPAGAEVPTGRAQSAGRWEPAVQDPVPRATANVVGLPAPSAGAGQALQAPAWSVRTCVAGASAGLSAPAECTSLTT